MGSKSPHLFFANANFFDKQNGRMQTAILNFANVTVADQWWKALEENGINGINKEGTQRVGPQWFSLATTSSPDASDIMREIETDPSMTAVRGQWSWTASKPDEVNGIPMVIPIQNESGWPVQDGASSNGAVANGGADWNDGPNWEGGSASYQLVDIAYRKAQDLKSKGDDRSFGMIFAQLSMELRRKP